MFELQAESRNNINMLRLTGDVLLPEVVAFYQWVEDYLAASNVPQVVLDLSQTGQMDKAGLGVLINLCFQLQRRGRRLVLLNPAPHVAQLLKDTEIDGFFPVCEREEDIKGYMPDLAG